VPVEFLLDGGHLASDSTPFIPPGGSHTFAAPYTPVAGVHTLGIRVDPLNTIIESDKSNNYAEMPVNAALPDLVPWNITIHDGASAAYVDPATTGYVSDVFNASWGETWDISFEMKNTGNASAGGQIGAVVQETIDLRGPPISPPLYDAAANLSLGPGEEYQFGTAFWSVPPADGMHYFNVTVDADNSIAESSKGNNTFVIRVSVGAPDLTVSVTGAPRVPVGGVWQPSVSVRNVGDRPSPGTTVEVTNASSGALINVITVSQLGPAQSESPAFAFPTTVPPGEYCLRFHVDSSDSIIEKNETKYEEFMMDDAKVAVIAYGTAARIAKGAVKRARNEGMRVGLIRPITLWPFPSEVICRRAATIGLFFVFEMSAGQMVEDVRLALNGESAIYFYGRPGGIVPTPVEVQRLITRQYYQKGLI